MKALIPKSFNQLPKSEKQKIADLFDEQPERRTMTDNTIIKAMEHCCDEAANCEFCPFSQKCEKEGERLITYALDLIKRQKAEIEHLRQMLSAAIAGQETMQRYFVSKGETDGIRLRYNEETDTWDRFDPYMTVECPEEKDYTFLETALAKQTLKKPQKESLANYNCPTCGAHINFDALNGKPEHAPKYCSECGQRLDWREKGANKHE